MKVDFKGSTHIRSTLNGYFCSHSCNLIPYDVQTQTTRLRVVMKHLPKFEYPTTMKLQIDTQTIIGNS